MRYLYSILLAFLFAFNHYGFAQNTDQKAILQKFAESRTEKYKLQKAFAVAWAQQNGYPVKNEVDGALLEIQYIDANNRPHYYITDNATAAATISTNKVYTGGGAGLNLDGAGITVCEWDGGSVLGTHQEFGTRVTVVDAVATHYHSTHVAGTIMASGVVVNARGMAYAANLRSYDWNNDIGEMAGEASRGSLISNHSYGEARGWYGGVWYGDPAISTSEDYLFGFYDEMARDWDIVAHNAPDFLICKSAGNDRGNTGTGYPADGPYDCIGNQGVSKNILTVGAVNDIAGGYTNPATVVMTSFSSWGPADDGRIKPDIVGNGSGLYSANNSGNTDYTTLSGTSMSSPSVAGSLALLQQHRNALTGSYMLASTLKALVVHTADEAGTADGPDYQFGWGLMNTKNAALKISADQTADVIGEYTLNEGGTYTRNIIALGTEPIKVTIVWNDPPGTPPAISLDPITPMLVNDLDLRITYSSNTYYPWKLDRNNPAGSATNAAENNVDNVEVVYIANPVADATYIITVDYDGTLAGGSQDFSMIISGMQPNASPVANFVANTTSPALGSQVNFTDITENIPASWNWSFSPSTITYLNGTSSTSQHPQVSFDAEGLYNVTLTAANAYGTDAETKTNYIHAYNCTYSTLPFAESFSGISAPVCWQILDNQGNGQVWQFGTATGTKIPLLSGNYAYLNSDAYGSGNSQNADLITPTLNLTSFKDIRLQFNHYFESSTGSSGTLSYSINNGSSWTTIQSFTATSTNPEDFDQVISAVTGKSEVKFKWNYTGTYAWIWAIDDIQITGTQVSTWTGITDSDWNKPGNWLAQAVPATTDNISVPSAGITHFPVISTAGIQCANLEISSGAVLTVASTGTLDVTGTLTNSAGSTGLFVESGGSLIHSTASVPATIKRSIGIWGPLASQGWHMLASPVAAQEFQPEFVPATPSASEDFYLWKESTNEWVNSKAGPDLGPWTFNTSEFGSTFEPGRGYLVAYGAAVTKNFIGTINTANVSYPLTNTDGTGRQGWNLCGNPFSSALTWNVETWLTGNMYVGGVAKILISSTGAYDDIIPGELIPALNGFFVHTDAATSLTIPAASRVHGGTWYKSGNETKKIVLTAKDIEGQTAQRCQIVINPEASTGFDRLYDGESVRLYAPSFYSIADGYHLSTNSLPAISHETVISLGFGKNAGSTYQIEASGADLPEMDAFMLDKKTNIRQNLSLEPVYRFTAADGDAEDRFVLYFGNVGLDEPDGNTGNLWFSDNTLYISAPTQAGQTALVEVFGVTGQRIFTKSVVLNKLTTLTVDYHGFVAVKVTTAGETLTGSGILKVH